eukprot:g23865.t1
MSVSSAVAEGLPDQATSSCDGSSSSGPGRSSSESAECISHVSGGSPVGSSTSSVAFTSVGLHVLVDSALEALGQELHPCWRAMETDPLLPNRSQIAVQITAGFFRTASAQEKKHSMQLYQTRNFCNINFKMTVDAKISDCAYCQPSSNNNSKQKKHRRAKGGYV